MTKPKRSGEKIDALYISRYQVEKWTDEELKIYINLGLPAAKRELEKREQKKKTT